MSQENCGCGQSQPMSGEYLLVAATASEQSTDGCVGTPAASTNDCLKQESTYDVSLSDFLLPSKDSITSMQVCNPSIYSIGEWIQFLDPVCTLKIVNITGNVLGLMNRCDSGEIVGDNPDVGQVIARNSKFIVAHEPNACGSDEAYRSRVMSVLNTATEVEMEALEASSATATVQPVGRVESDPGDLSVKKGLRRIFGILFKAGRPVLSQLGDVVPNSEVASYQRLVKSKSTHEVRRIRNYSEEPDLAANTQYTLAVIGNSEKLQGPSYVASLFNKEVKENTPIDTAPASWPVTSGTYTEDFDLSSISEIAAISAKCLLDHYWVMARFEMGHRANTDHSSAQATMNGVKVCSTRAHYPTEIGNLSQVNSVSVPIKVKKSDNKLTLSISGPSAFGLYFKLSLDGCYF